MNKGMANRNVFFNLTDQLSQKILLMSDKEIEELAKTEVSSNKLESLKNIISEVIKKEDV